MSTLQFSASTAAAANAFENKKPYNTKMQCATARAVTLLPAILRALERLNARGMCDRTSHIALWAQGRALSAAPPALNLYKVATATPKQAKTFAAFGLKSRSKDSFSKFLGARDAQK